MIGPDPGFDHPHWGGLIARRPELGFIHQGYQALRFWNDEARYERDAVLDTIFAVVEERRQMRDDR